MLDNLKFCYLGFTSERIPVMHLITKTYTITAQCFECKCGNYRRNKYSGQIPGIITGRSVKYRSRQRHSNKKDRKIKRSDERTNERTNSLLRRNNRFELILNMYEAIISHYS